MMTTETYEVADLFCGAGGSSTGVYKAAEEGGYKINLVAINHWELAIATHSANHPDARHLCENLDNVDPRKTIPGGYLDLLVASPECFPGGTLVLTENGYLPIEEIKSGTKVLTHRGRWRKVTSTMRDIKDTVIIKGQGHPGLEVTANHPIYARTWKAYHRVPKNASYRFRLLEPEWIDASKLTKKYMWAIPVVVEPLLIPPVPGRGFDFSEKFWWFVGLWLAEGSVRIRETNSEITISCAKYEADEIQEFLLYFKPLGKRANGSELRWRRRGVRTATLFETGHNGLAEWLVENFGKLARGKHIPAWVYGMPKQDRQALLDGYLFGDGHIERPKYSPKQTCQTVSKRLTFGIKTLAASLGFRPSVHVRTPQSNVIEDRKVKIHQAWGVHWTLLPQRKDGYNDGLHYWTLVKSINPGRRNVEVYNLSIEEDESYVAEGIVVHNCS